jgi:hypothetical protein
MRRQKKVEKADKAEVLLWKLNMLAVSSIHLTEDTLEL